MRINFKWMYRLALSPALVLVAQSAFAQSSNSVSATNAPAAHTQSAPQRMEASAFEMIPERNIFNANRSGGQVRVGSTRRPTQIETFTLVGTMAYEKGVFAFFEGSNSELSKVLKSNAVIAGHKLVDILANGVKLEADGKQFDLPVGSQMRREDQGPWRMAEASRRSSSESENYASSREGDSSSRESDSNGRYSRSGRSDSGRDSSRGRGRDDNGSSGRYERSERNEPSSQPTGAVVDEKAKEEALKRLLEKREKD